MWSRHPFGDDDRGHRFLCCFRFKLWWMTQRMGSYGREVPYETQFMLLEGPSDMYTVFLPLLDGPFRASLQGNVDNELQLCLESGESCSFLEMRRLAQNEYNNLVIIVLWLY